MPTSNLFIALAEVGVLIAGFASVFVMLDSRNRDVWPPILKIRFANILTLSLIASLFALFPLLLHAMEVGESQALTFAQFIMALTLSIFVAVRLLPSLRATQASNVGIGLFVLAVFLLIISILLQMLSAAQVLPLAQPGAYVTGVVLVLTVAGIAFYRMVMLTLALE